MCLWLFLFFLGGSSDVGGFRGASFLGMPFDLTKVRVRFVWSVCILCWFVIVCIEKGVFVIDF